MGSRFRIVLDPPYSMTDQKAHRFLPGDFVSGKIVLTAKDGEKIKEISVKLKGWLFAVSSNTSTRVTYSFDIFKISKVLQGATSLKASTQEYPFSLQIPHKFTSPVAWKGYDLPPDLYPSIGGTTWVTPPTCVDAGKLHDTYTDWKITYSLAAQGKKTFLNLSDELPIIITHPSTPNPLPGPLRNDARDGFKQSYAHANGIPRALTKSESLKGVVAQNAGTYKLNLSLLAQPTTAIIIDEPFTLSFTLQTDTPPSEYRLPVPDFQLTDYTINLGASTGVTVPYQKMFIGASAQGGFEIFPSKKTVNTPLRLNEPLQLQETLPSAFDSCPSFKTAFIERRYFFQIHAHVACLGSTTKLKILLPFWLHPSKGKVPPALAARPPPPPQEQRAQLPSPTAFPAAQPTYRVPVQPAHPVQPVQPAYQVPVQPAQASYQTPVQQSAPQAYPAPMAQMFCGFCGTSSTTAANYCPQCGSRF